jgi:hypothetical protein
MNEQQIIDFLEKTKDRSGPIKIVVAGSRGYSDYIGFRAMMHEILKLFPDTEFLSGDASKGPDRMIIEYANDCGYVCHKYPAAWEDIGVPDVRIKVNDRGRQYNANAGHVRNQQMAELADFYIIFWDGKSPGTKDMIKRCESIVKHGFVIIV